MNKYLVLTKCQSNNGHFIEKEEATDMRDLLFKLNCIEDIVMIFLLQKDI